MHETADRLMQLAEQNAQCAVNRLHELNNRVFIVPEEELRNALEDVRRAEHQIQGVLYMIEGGR